LPSKSGIEQKEKPSMTPPLDPLSTRSSSDTVQWPSLRTYWGAFKRQFLLATLLSLPVAGLVLLGLSQWPSEFTSNAVMLYDPIQGVTETAETPFVAANRLAATLTARFQDPEFLARLAKRLEAKGYPQPEISDSIIKTYLGSVMPDSLRPPSWSMTPEQRKEKVQVEQILKLLTIQAVPATFQLSLSAKGETPEEAQLLTQEAIELFIREELGKERDKLLLQADQLATLEASLLREKTAPSEIARTEGVRTGSVGGGDKKLLKAREQSLINEVLSKQGELSRLQGNQTDRSFELEADLTNLLSRKGPAHPDVIQKQREIDQFRNDPAVRQLEGELVILKRRLTELQNEMRSKGVAIDRSVQISSFPDGMQTYLMEVSRQIRSLELQAAGLEEQLQDPRKRTRFNLVREPELPNTPSNRKKLLAAVAVGVAMVLGTFFLTILVRELFHPMIIDRDLFRMRYGLPVAAEVKGRWQKGHALLTAEKIRGLRPRLNQLLDRRVVDLQLLDSLRFMQQLLTKPGTQNQVICVLDMTHGGPAYSLANNLANVMATDSAERVFVLNFNPGSSRELQAEGATDLMSFLGGQAEWKDCRIKSGPTLAFEAALAQNPEQQLEAFREDMLRKLIKALRDKYQRIIIDGFQCGYFTENSLLCREADAVVLQVGLGQTRKADLDRFLEIEGYDKVKAVLLRV
jgi:hypothetical protein